MAKKPRKRRDAVTLTVSMSMTAFLSTISVVLVCGSAFYLR